jgi:HAD superfamily hydrolase (TIGR01509 family)
MSKIKAIFFDQDGVIIDTERYGHRVAFNKAFKEFGYQYEWDTKKYHELLQIAGGKERIRHFLNSEGFEFKKDGDNNLIQNIHRRKTEIFVELIKSGDLPLRPGVKRLMKEVTDKKLILGICTTSNEKAAHEIAYQRLKDIQFDFVLAGDIVKNKKPNPDIYNLALKNAGLKPEECVAVEDSHNGIMAAKSAGLNIIATPNDYTDLEDLSAADLIVSCLGDENGEKGFLKSNTDLPNYDGVLHLNLILEFFQNG